jgi:MFS transporter
MSSKAHRSLRSGPASRSRLRRGPDTPGIALSSSRGIHRREHRQIAVYFGLTFFVFYLCVPQGGFADIPIQYLLKDRFKLGPERIAFVRLLIAAPTYVAFLFGFMRDRWSPLGKHDRGIFWIAGLIAALAYGWLATGEATYVRLLAGAIAATVAYRFLGAATQGLAAEVGKERGMTGRLSTLWNIVWSSLIAAAYMIGGWASDHLSTADIFGLLGLLTLIYVAIAFWKPAAVFSQTGQPNAEEPPRRLWPEIVRLGTHRPMWPAAAIWLLWSFAPGFSTPLLFYLTDHIRASPTQFGLFNAIFAVSFLPTYFLYGYLCPRVSLHSLLWWGTIVAVPQMLPLLFLRTPGQALFVAIPIGLSGGVATAAYVDLLMRSCPKKLEGTGMMIADTGYYTALRFGDVFGAWLYVKGGFALTAWITTGVYALILPLLLLVPKAVIAGHDADERTDELLVKGELSV